MKSPHPIDYKTSDRARRLRSSELITELISGRIMTAKCHGFEQHIAQAKHSPLDYSTPACDLQRIPGNDSRIELNRASNNPGCADKKNKHSRYNPTITRFFLRFEEFLNFLRVEL